MNGILSEASTDLDRRPTANVRQVSSAVIVLTVMQAVGTLVNAAGIHEGAMSGNARRRHFPVPVASARGPVHHVLRPGDVAPPFTLRLAKTAGSASLVEPSSRKPVVLIFGSYT